MKIQTGRMAATVIVLALTAMRSLAQSIYEPYTFTTLAGYVGYGSADGIGSGARFHSPGGVALDGAGNLYVADTDNNTIRKVTPAGVVTTLAGFAELDDNGLHSTGGRDGIGSGARFKSPEGVAVDSAGNVYVADSGNNTIRKVTPAGVVTTLAGLAGRAGSADGIGSAARFNYPGGVAIDGAGTLYVADTDNYTIRKVTPAGVVTTLAGLAGSQGSADGTGSAARFGWSWGYGRGGPGGVAVDSGGNVYVADAGNNTIRKVTPVGVVTTLAGLAKQDSSGTPVFGSADGTGSAARFGWDSPDAGYGWSGVAVDSGGNIYVADTGNNTIRKGYPALKITSSRPNIGFNGGHFGFGLVGGPAGKVVVVEGSTDLVSWLPLWTNTPAGPLNFSDAHSGVSSLHFYRARLP